MEETCYDVMRFAEKLMKVIDLSGKSQSRLQRETGISQSAISEMTKGKRRPYLDQAFLLARALGVSLDYLADEALEAPQLPVEALGPEDRLVLKTVQHLGHAEAMRRLVGEAPADSQGPGQVRVMMNDEFPRASDGKTGRGSK